MEELSKILLVCLVVVSVTLSIFGGLLNAKNDQLVDEINSCNKTISNLIDEKNDMDISLNKEIRELTRQVVDWQILYESFDCPDCPQPNTEIEYIYIYYDICDVNRDGIVNFNDAFEVYSYIHKSYKPIEEYIYLNYQKDIYDRLYDVNIDGRVNESDLQMIWELSD